MPTQDPFLYTVSLTATEGVALAALEEAALTGIDRVRVGGITEHELDKAKRQLRARLVFENDSITNIAHQLGYFETIASWTEVPSIGARLDAVTLDQVAAVAAARLTARNRTIGWFQPFDSAQGGPFDSAQGGPFDSAQGRSPREDPRS
jgi:predicted Zn-dependent peptidase